MRGGWIACCRITSCAEHQFRPSLTAQIDNKTFDNLWFSYCGDNRFIAWGSNFWVNDRLGRVIFLYRFWEYGLCAGTGKYGCTVGAVAICTQRRSGRGCLKKPNTAFGNARWDMSGLFCRAGQSLTGGIGCEVHISGHRRYFRGLVMRRRATKSFLSADTSARQHLPRKTKWYWDFEDASEFAHQL